jgi:phospholipid-binding lipoprotein MlaA
MMFKKILKNLILITGISCISFNALAKAPAATSGNFSIDEDAEFDSFADDNSAEIYDPLEKYNRKIFTFNDTLDRYIFEHVARAYRNGIPSPARTILRNFLNNLSLPISAANSILQGKVDNSLATISNFLINTTVGVGGLFDVAGQKGIAFRREDFGQTLGHYGVTSGAYLMIPLLGPSSTRDFTGFAVDKSVDPMGFNVLNIGGKEGLVEGDYRFAAGALLALDIRESLLDIIDDIRKDSFDPYATIRSAYLQKRVTEIKN